MGILVELVNNVYADLLILMQWQNIFILMQGLLKVKKPRYLGKNNL